MDLKEIYENKTGKDPWFECELTGTYGLTQDYVEWLEKQLTISGVSGSFSAKDMENFAAKCMILGNSGKTTKELLKDFCEYDR